MRLPIVLPCVALAATVLTASAASANAVVIVNGPGVAYGDIQSAVNAAADGDVLLVAAGNYSGFTIDGKSLTILRAPGGGTAALYGTIEIDNLGPQQSVALIDLTIQGPTSATHPYGVSLANDVGAVLLQGCTIAGGRRPGGYPTCPPSGPAVLAVSASRVSLTGCTLTGGTGDGGCGSYPAPILGGDGGAAVETSLSRVALQGCQLVGGTAGRGTDRCGVGGAGARVDGGFLFATNSTFRGADGAPACSVSHAGDGGDGIDSAGNVHLSGCSLTGGAGGGGQTNPIPGDPGLPSTGPVTLHPNSERTLTGPRFSQSPGVVTVTVIGSPNEAVYLTSSNAAQWHWTPLNSGVFWLPFPAYFPVEPDGIIPASGVLDLQARLPDLPVGVDTGLATIQGLVIAPDATRRLTHPVHIVLVRASSPPDCNGDQMNEYIQLMSGTAGDCNLNLLPDACESLPGLDQDCNANGVSDYCDIFHGTSVDANDNTVPDECDPHATWYVDVAAAPGGDGSQAHPFQDIASGLAASQDYDTVFVADGIYTGGANRELDLHGKVVSLLSAHGPATCVIDCQSAGRAFQLTGSGVPGSSLIAGFTIVNGSAFTGGGISVDTARVRIANCIVSQCSAAAGGGIYLANTNSVVKFCTINGNVATGGLATQGIDGGGIMVFQGYGFQTLSRVVVSHCRILDNHAANPSIGTGGGGIGLFNQLAIHSASSGLYVDDCLLAGNSSSTYGGGIGSKLSGTLGANLVVTNSTFVGNSSALGGGLCSYGALVSRIANCIVWNNTASIQGAQIYAYVSNASSSTTVSYSDVQGGLTNVSVNGVIGAFHWGAGNLDLNPRFMDADGPDNVLTTWIDNDYRLAAVSPCIDAGDNSGVPADLTDIDDDGNLMEIVPRDLDLNARFYDTLGVPDTGVGVAPIVDLGGYEHPSG